MMKLKKSSVTTTIDMVFILALLAVFGITSFFVIMIGAKQYQSIADEMSDNYENRTISSYLEEKINQSDHKGSCSIITLDSVDVLSLTQMINEKSYTTYIYSYDGYLWEITVTSDTAISLGSGQKIIETGPIAMTSLATNLYQFTITSTTGESYSQYVSFNAK